MKYHFLKSTILKPTVETLGPTIDRQLTEEENYERVMCLRYEVLQAKICTFQPPIVDEIEMAWVNLLLIHYL